MTVQIVKYVNRKLHVEGQSKYLSMLELSDLAAKESDLRVVCDRTGLDITLETLSRALYERLKKYNDEDRFVESGRRKPAPFPVKSLTKLMSLVPRRKRT